MFHYCAAEELFTFIATKCTFYSERKQVKKIASLQTALVMSCAAVFTALQNECLLGTDRNISSTTLVNP